MHGKYPIFSISFQHLWSAHQDGHIKVKENQCSHIIHKNHLFERMCERYFMTNIDDPSMITNTTNDSVNTYY